MERIKKQKKLGMIWFSFYTKIRPVFVCISVFSVIIDFAQYTNTYLYNGWLFLYFLTAIIQAVLCIIVSLKSNGDYAAFVHFVRKVLLFETVSIAYQQGVEQYISNGFQVEIALMVSIIVLLVCYFVWYRLNVKYFEKRLNAIASKYLTESIIYNTDKICFCRKCGEKLIDGSIFCNKCGTSIVKE